MASSGPKRSENVHCGWLSTEFMKGRIFIWRDVNRH